MCGIVGVAGKIGIKEDKVMKTLLILDALRGVDSTGIAAVPKNGDVRVVKQLGNPYELFETRGYMPAINRANRAIIGHNRFATQGEVNRKNAHPFEFDTLVGVHNGTLRNKYRLLDSNLFKVDSENLYYHIENEGLDHFLEIVDGAYALVWWDKVNETLNFLRNKERPMWCVKSIDGDTIFWASERWMLEVAIGREDIKIGEYHWMMEDMLYTIDINAEGKMDKPQVSPAAAKHVPYVYTGQQGKWKGNGAVGDQKKLILVENKTPTQGSQTTTTKPTTSVPSETEKKSALEHSIASRKYYVSSKGLSFEIMAECTDSNGASFLALFDSQEPHIKVRLYLKRNDPLYGNVGSTIIGDIKDIHISPSEGAYYKVGYSSVKLVEEVEEEADIDLSEIPVKNHRGKEISQTEFIQTYSACGCCDGFVDPQGPYKFTVSGEAVCSSCLSTPEAIKYISLA